MNTILVQGATGNAGYAIVKALLKQGQNFTIRAGVHDDSKVDKIAALGPGIDIVKLDTQYPQSVRSALRGVSKLMVCPPNTEDKMEITKLLIQAAVDSSIQHIVLISVLGADKGAVGFQKQFNSLELFAERSGIPFTVIRCPTYMENLYIFAPQIARGELRLPLGAGSTVMVDIDDVGECAATILTSQDTLHHGKVYNITGSEPLNGQRIAADLTQGFGTPVNYVPISDGEAYDNIINAGFSPFQATGFVEIFDLLALGGGEFVSRDSFDLLGRAPTPLSVWAREHHHSILECAREINDTHRNALPPGSIIEATNGQGQQIINQQGQQGAANPFAQSKVPQGPCVTRYQRTPFPHLTGHSERWFEHYYPLHEERRFHEAIHHVENALPTTTIVDNTITLPPASVM